MFERSEFLTLPIFDLHNWAPEGQWQRGRLSLLTFFGEAKKVSGCRATPDLLNDEQQVSQIQTQATKQRGLHPPYKTVASQLQQSNQKISV